MIVMKLEVGDVKKGKDDMMVNLVIVKSFPM